MFRNLSLTDGSTRLSSWAWCQVQRSLSAGGSYGSLVPMSIECMGVWVFVQAHREHTGVKVRVLYMFTRMFVCVHPCACLVVCLCVYIPRCACVQVPNLYTFRGVCMLRFQISIHSGCVCSQHERGGQRDGGRGKERLLLIISTTPTPAGGSCRMPLHLALPSSGN